MKSYRWIVFSFLVLSVFFPVKKLQAGPIPVAHLPGLNRLSHLFDVPKAPHGVYEFAPTEYLLHYNGEIPGVEVQVTIVRKEYWDEEDDVYVTDRNYGWFQFHFGKGEKTKIFETGIGGMVAPTCGELPSLSSDMIFTLVKLVGMGVAETKGSIGPDDTARVKVIFDPELIDKCK